MQAAVCRAFGKRLTIEEIDLAPPGAGEIRVKVAACAICHSDIIYADGGWGGTLPAVYGHEAAGVVEEIGAGVTHLVPGDHVVVTLIRFCGHCVECARGSQILCEAVFPLDTHSPITARGSGKALHQGMRTGAFAEAVVVHASQAVAIGKDVPLDVASLIACGVLTGLGAVTNTARVGAGECVVVIGTGGVGLNSVQGAALVGASPIIALDLSEEKRAAARRFGATHAFDPRDSDLAARVKDANGGRLADWVFVTVGAKSAFDQANGLMKPGGAVIVVGMPAAGVMGSYDPGWLAAGAQRIIGSKMGNARIRIDVPRIVDLYRQRRLKLDELISGRYPIANINEAMDSVRRGHALRNVIVF
jgi:Zn-dependent alcohol dehydrogenase